MSEVLDKIIANSKQTVIINRDEAEEIIKKLFAQKFSVFKSGNVEGSMYQNVINALSIGYNLSTEKLNDITLEEVVFLLSNSPNAEYFQTEFEKRRDAKIAYPSFLASNLVIMIANSKSYLARQFMKISYTTYKNILVNKSPKAKMMIYEINEGIDCAIKKNPGKLNSINDVVTVLKKYTATPFYPGIIAIDKYEHNMKSVYYAYYTFIVTSMTGILNSAEKYKIGDLVKEYEEAEWNDEFCEDDLFAEFDGNKTA